MIHYLLLALIMCSSSLYAMYAQNEIVPQDNRLVPTNNLVDLEAAMYMIEATDCDLYTKAEANRRLGCMILEKKVPHFTQDQAIQFLMAAMNLKEFNRVAAYKAQYFLSDVLISQDNPETYSFIDTLLTEVSTFTYKNLNAPFIDQSKKPYYWNDLYMASTLLLIKFIIDHYDVNSTFNNEKLHSLFRPLVEVIDKHDIGYRVQCKYLSLLFIKLNKKPLGSRSFETVKWLIEHKHNNNKVRSYAYYLAAEHLLGLGKYEKSVDCLLQAFEIDQKYKINHSTLLLQRMEAYSNKVPHIRVLPKSSSSISMFCQFLDYILKQEMIDPAVREWAQRHYGLIEYELSSHKENPSVDAHSGLSEKNF